MMSEIICGVVRSAHHLDVKLLQNGLRGQSAGQRCIRALPDFRSGLLIEQFGNAKVALQLEVRPVVEGIAQRVGNSSRPRQEFLVGRGISRNIFFRDPIRPHGPPFVVISLQPDFKEIREIADFQKCLGETDDSGNRGSAAARQTHDRDGVPHRSTVGSLR